MVDKTGPDSLTLPAARPPWFEVAPGGAELRVHVQPGARRTSPAGVHGSRLKLAVAAPANDGRANDALLVLVARMAGVPRRAVTVASGASARDKRLRIAGDAEAILAQLQSALHAAAARSGRGAVVPP